MSARSRSARSAPNRAEQVAMRSMSARGPRGPPVSATYSFAADRVRTDSLQRPSTSAATPRRGLYTLGSERKQQRKAAERAKAQVAFKSDVNALEVAVIERLRDVKARAEPPCPLRMAVYRDLFDALISRDPLHGPLLAQIRHEYEVTLNPLESDGVKRLYDEALLENDKLRATARDNAKDARSARDREVAVLTENASLRAALDERSAQLEEANERLNAINPGLASRQERERRLREVEEETMGGSADGDPFQHPQVRSVIGELEAELAMIKKRERIAASEAAEYRDALSRIDPENYPPDARVTFDDDGDDDDDGLA
jgi:hypothetical protein